MDDGDVSPWKVVTGIVGVVVVIWLIVFVISWAGARATPKAGQIGVVRGGSSGVWVGAWFNGHGIKKVIKPGSGSSYIGLGSKTHWYPDDGVQRNYTISSSSDQGDVQGTDVEELPTSDGVRVGLEGTFYFTTAFNAGAQGQELVKDFDNRFGIRQFQETRGSKELYPWEGNDGWAAFLSTVIRPIIDNDLRRAIANVTCSQLISSCALVHQQSVKAVKGGQQNNATIQAIQTSINSSLESDIARTLGKDYFSNVQFLVQKVGLPGSIQTQIDSAQAQFAAVGTAQAQVQQAKLQAKANRERESGYKGCPACAQIDELKAIPSNVTTFAPGAGFAVTK